MIYKVIYQPDASQAVLVIKINNKAGKTAP